MRFFIDFCSKNLLPQKCRHRFRIGFYQSKWLSDVFLRVAFCMDFRLEKPNKKPCRFFLPVRRRNLQGETIFFDDDGRFVYLISENSLEPHPVYRIEFIEKYPEKAHLVMNSGFSHNQTENLVKESTDAAVEVFEDNNLFGSA